MESSSQKRRSSNKKNSFENFLVTSGRKLNLIKTDDGKKILKKNFTDQLKKTI